MRLPLLLLLPLLLACAGRPTETATAAQAPGAFLETFETGAKGAYETADESLATGPWLFTEALIGSSEQDHKNGSHAARLRAGGRLTMQFDAPAGVRRIRILAASYGGDAPSTWELWLSRDHGRTWQRQGQPQTTTGPTLTAATFAGVANEPLRLEIRKTDAGKTRLNLDDISLETSGGPVATGPATAPTPASPVPGPPRVAPGSGGYAGTRPDNDNLLLGNPSGATSDPANATNYLLTRPQFTTGYNATRGIPTWTSWHLGRTDITKNFPRQNDFRADPGLPRQFYQVTPQSYGGSGFDKGHNCPSGDRTNTLDDNSATFLMSNMVPQAPQNNQQTWAHLEEYTRAQIERGQEAYIVMGSYGRGGTGKNGPAQTLDQGRVTVPAHIWKVVVLLPEGPNDFQRILAGQARILAVDTPNDNSLSPDWKQYLTTVNKIEAASGLDILSALPAATQAQLQQVLDSGRAE